MATGPTAVRPDSRTLLTVSTRKTELEATLIISGDADASQPPPAGDLVPVRPALVSGARLDHYVIEQEIGAGGMGVVYKADDTLLDRVVALKVLPPRLCEQDEFLRRFAREARLLARIQSPHVVTVHTLMEKDIGLVLVMEFLEGETLEQRLRRDGPLSASEAVEVFDQASRGVEHIHEMGIVHQDLKPANIFLTTDGDVKLLDFGVAKLMNERHFDQTGTMLGTLLYISPEQIKGRAVDQRSDIYTLGITMFEAVTGRLPFERKTNYALMHAHVQESPPAPRKFQTEIPAQLEKVILKAMAKEPERRFQTIRKFRKALLQHRRVRLPRLRSKPALLSAPTTATAGAADSPEALLKRRPRFVDKRGLLGTLAFDGLVLTGVLVLAFFLDVTPQLRPITTATATQTHPVTDKYATVRKLWGNQQP
jgi:serine/threonine protein kinase